MRRYTFQTRDAWTSLGKTFSTLDSTSAQLQRDLQQARTNLRVLPEGYNIRADFQSAGRGRMGRIWEAAPGENLSVSYLLSPAGLSPASLFTLSQNLSLVVRDLVQGYFPEQQCYVKWPNDVYIEEQKLAGILVESSLSGDEVLYVVAGIGLNVNQRNFEDLPHATSLGTRCNHLLNVEQIWRNLTVELQIAHQRLKEMVSTGDTHPIAVHYHQHLYGLNQWARYTELASGVGFAARLVGVDHQGKLRLEHDGQTSHYTLDQIKFERFLQRL